MMNPKESPEQAPQDDRQPPMETGADELETLSRQLAEAETSLAGMRETLLRERADLENQRKRMQRDLEQSLKFANEKLLRDLLPVYDGLESGLAVETADVASMRHAEKALEAGFGQCIEKSAIPQLPELLRAMAREAA